MNRRIWAVATAVIGLGYAALLWLETVWWFWPSPQSHRLAMAVGGSFALIWALLYFRLKE